MIVNDALEQVLAKLLDRNLSEALVAMDAYLTSHLHQNDAHLVEAVKADFQLMTDYWRRGYKDPQLSGLYDNLLRRLYVIYANAALGYAVGNSSYLSSIYMRLTLTARDWSVQALREILEAHVSEVAMLELEPADRRVAHRKNIYQRHHQLMSEWFDNVWLSTLWTDGQAMAMEELLLSPTIDSKDQQLLISGMMIAAINHFDVAKFRCLVHVYLNATEEPVRQRALVGWVLSLHGTLPGRLYREDLKELETMLEDQSVCEELVQLQQQIIFCINAEKDNQTIQQEIMPDLLKSSNFRVTRNGIEEIEEDALEDILHPDAEDRRIEQVEESFLRMQNMQKQGSDIYFGGFSQMKRFPFFSEICNWFVPFYIDHPGICDVVERFRSNRFLLGMMKQGPFCSSDKYSFLLVFGQVMDRIPRQMREMMEHGEASVGEVLSEELRSAAYIRRTYLQDVYRFYRIYSRRHEFHNPFDRDRADYLFFAHPVFMKTHLEPYFNEVTAFLIKQKMHNEAGLVLENCGMARRDFRYYMMAGYLVQWGYFQFEDGDQTDLRLYQQALQFQPENEKALQGYARALFEQERYEEAQACYEKLVKIQPDKRNYQLNRAVCLSKLKRYADALKDLYRLNYETPDDLNVNRVLAWTLTCADKYEQADKIYSQIMAGSPQPEDLLNYGYSLWLGGHTDEAADCFHRYLKESDEQPRDILDKERELLFEKGITEAEMQLMLYIL